MTIVESEPEPVPQKPAKEKNEHKWVQKFEQCVGIIITPIFKSGGIIGNAYYTIGYKFNKKIIAGIGIGFGGYDYDDYNTCHAGGFMIPISINGRYYFKDSHFRPFVDLSTGIDLMIETHREYTKRSSYGLLHVNPSIGVNYEINNRIACFISLGYRYFDYDCHGLSINLGIAL